MIDFLIDLGIVCVFRQRGPALQAGIFAVVMLTIVLIAAGLIALR